MRPLLAAFASLVAALALAGPVAAITNPQVAGLQVALRSWGYYHGPIDAIAGPQTVAGVRAFQRRARLAVDGIAGPRTRAALGRVGRPLFGRRMLRRGVHGWDVAVLQFLLRKRGVSPGIVDGYFGAETERALRRLQRRRGLAADGIAGPRTLAALGAPHLRAGPVRVRVRRTPGPHDVRASLDRWSRHYGISPRLARALAWMESGFQPTVVSPAGAWGVMQVTPATWEFVETVLIGRGVPRTTDGNVRVGVAYLHHLLHLFRGRERLAIGAYYQGAAAVRRYGLFPETRRFVADVLALKQRV